MSPVPDRKATRLSEFAFLVLLPALAGCVPHSVFSYAATHGMVVSQTEGDAFRHLVIRKFALSPPQSRLHVYLEGDGIPWTGNRPSVDPTPRITLALSLASQDSTDVAYIGRPCYFRVSDAEVCRPRYWTSHRYGEEVVASIAAAIERVRQSRHTEIVLIGYSGGGALAALLESRIPGVVAVVSIAANLDIDAWTDFHDYDRLDGSLNPILQSRDPHILHLQLVGARDDTVPPATSAAYSSVRPGVELIEFEQFDHVCCWEDQWPSILELLADQIARAATCGPDYRRPGQARKSSTLLCRKSMAY